MYKRLLLLTLISLCCLPNLSAKTYFVDGDKEINGDGSFNAPFHTIQKAAEIMEPGDTCYIREGIYRESIIPFNSGTLNNPIVYKAYKNENVTISGTELVDHWEKIDENIYSSNVVMDLSKENQVFANGEMILEARWPNVGSTGNLSLYDFKMATMDEGTNPSRIVDFDLPQKNYSNASVWVSSNKKWFCWTGKILEHKPGRLTIKDNSTSREMNSCKKGGNYYIYGSRALLDTANEWYYSSAKQRLYVWMPKDTHPGNRIEIKKRKYAFDLRNHSNIKIHSVDFFFFFLLTNKRSDGITLTNSHIKYIYHSSKATNQYSSQLITGLVLKGNNHTIKNCEIAYSSGNGISLMGSNFKIINNYIHHANYIGSYAAPVTFVKGTKGHILSHNTIHYSGRSIINTSGMYDCLFQYNDVGYAGYLTDDLGLIYGNGVEGGNTEIRFNHFHHNTTGNCGIYFDHGSKNFIVHHNFISNVSIGICNNLYSNYFLYYNNTISSYGNTFYSTWNAAQKKDLYGTEFINNLATKDIKVEGKWMKLKNNIFNYKNLTKKKYPAPETKPVDAALYLKNITTSFKGNAPDIGAFELGEQNWEAGHNFKNPSQNIDTARSLPLWRNLLKNTALYNGKLNHWKISGNNVRVISENNNQHVNDGRAMMGGYSIELASGKNAIEQKITNLENDITYELMGMFRVDEGEKAHLGIKNLEGKIKTSLPISSNSPYWNRRIVRFKADSTKLDPIVFFEKSSKGDKEVYVDDVGLKRVGKTHTIEFKIYGKNKEGFITPLEDATIKISNRETKTNYVGESELLEIPGKHEISINKNNYKIKYIEVKLNNDTTIVDTLSYSKDNFVMYPNPASEYIYIELTDEALDSKILIYSINGKALLNRRFNTKKK